jgi:hypothetical protein
MLAGPARGAKKPPESNLASGAAARPSRERGAVSPDPAQSPRSCLRGQGARYERASPTQHSENSPLNANAISIMDASSSSRPRDSCSCLARERRLLYRSPPVEQTGNRDHADTWPKGYRICLVDGLRRPLPPGAFATPPRGPFAHPLISGSLGTNMNFSSSGRILGLARA